MLKKEFTHELYEKFKYSDDGSFHEAEIITVEAPKSRDFYTNLQFLDSLVIKAEMRNIKNVAGLMSELGDIDENKQQEYKKVQDEKPEEEKALDAYSQLIGGLDKDEIEKLDICIKEILKSSGKVNGDKNFEDSFYDDLSIEDRRVLIGMYIVNFTSTAQRALKRP